MNNSSTIYKLLEIINSLVESELEFVNEMANLNNKDHKLNIDLKIHIDQPGNKLPPHFARVKIFRGDFSSTPHKFTLTLPDLKIVNGDSSWLSNKECKKVLKFVQNNTDNFISLFKDQGLGVSDLNWRYE